MYHPTLGRWKQRDPMAYVDGLSLYQYVTSSPPDATDATGLAGSRWACCLKSLDVSFGEVRTGTLRRRTLTYDFEGRLVPDVRYIGVKRWVDIRITAVFDSQGTSPGGLCCDGGCCEYRQETWGRVLRDMRLLDVPLLPGTFLHPDLRQEDGNRENQPYGHRSGGRGQYIPLANGDVRFEARDTPHMICLAGEHCVFDVHFRGYIIDACRDDNEVGSRRWDINWDFAAPPEDPPPWRSIPFRHEPPRDMWPPGV